MPEKDIENVDVDVEVELIRTSEMIQKGKGGLIFLTQDDDVLVVNLPQAWKLANELRKVALEAGYKVTR